MGIIQVGSKGRMIVLQKLDLISSASSRILNVSSAPRNELPLYSKNERVVKKRIPNYK